jgi:hypothetical protein
MGGEGSSSVSTDAFAKWIAALVVLASTLALFVLGPIVRWPEPLVLRVTNETNGPVLVDTRMWDGSLGGAGPIAETLAAGGTATLRHWTTSAPCVRVVDPASGRVGAGLVAGATQPGDTVSVRVLRPTGGGPPGPNLSRPCPTELAEDRIRIGLGRYFDPGNPARILRERILRTYY